MVPHSKYVSSITPAYTQALLPDNSVLAVREQGILRISVFDQRTHRRWIIPLVDTLVVKGLRVVLWSVPKFASEGHRITFDGTSVKLVLNANGPKEGRLTLLIAHPYLRQTAGPTAGVRNVRANVVTRAAARRERTAERRRQASQQWASSQDTFCIASFSGRGDPTDPLPSSATSTLCRCSSRLKRVRLRICMTHAPTTRRTPLFRFMRVRMKIRVPRVRPSRFPVAAFPDVFSHGPGLR